MAYLDPNHWEVANLISDMKSTLYQNEMLDLVSKLGRHLIFTEVNIVFGMGSIRTA